MKSFIPPLLILIIISVFFDSCKKEDPDPNENWTAGKNWIDSRDGLSYKTIQIGSQVWMAENLNVGIFVYTTEPGTYPPSVSNNDTIEKYCHNNNINNCDIYGGLYEWDEMMMYGNSDAEAIGTTQGICPDGWHLPTDIEWAGLINHLGGSEIAGGKLKESGISQWNYPNAGATNESGFNALPGGYWYSGGFFSDPGITASFWCSTEVSAINVPSFYLNYSDSYIARDHHSYKPNGFSVRCVKD